MSNISKRTYDLIDKSLDNRVSILEYKDLISYRQSPIYKHTVYYICESDFEASQWAYIEFILHTPDASPITTGAQFKQYKDYVVSARGTSYGGSDFDNEEYAIINISCDDRGISAEPGPMHHNQYISGWYPYESEEQVDPNSRRVTYTDNVIIAEEVLEQLIATDGTEVLPRTTAEKVDVAGKKLTQVLQGVQGSQTELQETIERNFDHIVHISRTRDYQINFSDIAAEYDAWAVVNWVNVTAKFKTKIENPSINNISEWLDDFNSTAYDFTGYRRIYGEDFEGNYHNFTEDAQPFTLELDTYGNIRANNIRPYENPIIYAFYSELINSTPIPTLKNGQIISLRTSAAVTASLSRT